MGTSPVCSLSLCEFLHREFDAFFSATRFFLPLAPFPGLASFSDLFCHCLAQSEALIQR